MGEKSIGKDCHGIDRRTATFRGPHVVWVLFSEVRVREAIANRMAI